jgi:hypothetical protein
MKYKQLVKRFENLGLSLEYKFGSDGKGYYLSGSYVTSSREVIEERLYNIEEDRNSNLI